MPALKSAGPCLRWTRMLSQSIRDLNWRRMPQREPVIACESVRAAWDMSVPPFSEMPQKARRKSHLLLQLIRLHRVHLHAHHPL